MRVTGSLRGEQTRGQRTEDRRALSLSVLCPLSSVALSLPPGELRRTGPGEVLRHLLPGPERDLARQDVPPAVALDLVAQQVVVGAARRQRRRGDLAPAGRERPRPP